ncbi:hypothetical protein ABKN59_002386 [Abortiporus biennis]
MYCKNYGYILPPSYDHSNNGLQSSKFLEQLHSVQPPYDVVTIISFKPIADCIPSLSWFKKRAYITDTIVDTYA